MPDEQEVGQVVDQIVKVGPEAVLRRMVEAVFDYRDTKNPAALEDFAQAVLAATRVRSVPGHQSARTAAPHWQTRPGRDLAEIFADKR
jgi:hypothetical protein